MASLMPTGKQQFFDSPNGRPLAGGKLYTYAVGTTTPKATYSDAAGTIQNSNPIILDSRGEALIFWSGSYDVVLRDANENLIYSVSNYATDAAAKVLTDLADTSGASLVGFQQSGSGAVPRTVQDELRERVSVKQFGAKGDGVTDDTAAIRNAISAAGGGGLVFPAGVYVLSDEIAIDKTIRILCASSDEYSNGGTRFLVSHNDASKAGFKVGYTNKTIQFELEGMPTFDAPVGYAAYAGLRITAATMYIEGFRGTANINGVLIEDSYIGSVKRLAGSSKSYLCKVSGNSSISFETVNLGGSSGGLASFQISTNEGFTNIEHIYLEAQSVKNLAIASTGASVVRIGTIYAENSAEYDVSISNAQNILIENYRTNTNTKSVVISNSHNVKINNIFAVSRLEKYEIVDIDSASTGIYIGGVIFDPVTDYGAGDLRDYVLVRGVFDGAPAEPCVTNPTLMLSANKTTSVVGGSGISTNVPTDRRVRFSDRSINVTSAAPVKLGFTKWRPSSMVVVQAVYTCSDVGESDVFIKFMNNGSTELKRLQYFHRSSASPQVVTIITRLPSTAAVNQYSSLEFCTASGKTAELHYLNMSFYDGGQLPLGALENSTLIASDAFSLNATSDNVLLPLLGGKLYKFKNYELVYTVGTGGAGSAATVGFGDASSSGGLPSAWGNFTTAINSGKGALCSVLAATGSWPFRDHATTTANGVVVSVTAAATHGGSAKMIVRAVECDANTI